MLFCLAFRWKSFIFSVARFYIIFGLLWGVAHYRKSVKSACLRPPLAGGGGGARGGAWGIGAAFVGG